MPDVSEAVASDPVNHNSSATDDGPVGSSPLTLPAVPSADSPVNVSPSTPLAAPFHDDPVESDPSASSQGGSVDDSSSSSLVVASADNGENASPSTLQEALSHDDPSTSLAVSYHGDLVQHSPSTSGLPDVDVASCRPRISPAMQSIRQLHPLPKAAARARKRKAEAAEILTASPYKNVLIAKEKANKKNVSKDKPKERRPKKQTCRKDKRRGPKPKACLNLNFVAGNSKQKSSEHDNPDDYCAGCGEHVSESNSDWIQCRRCSLWYELECAGMLGKPRSSQNKFICEVCQ